MGHPEFLSGTATTSFIDRHPQLFNFSARGAPHFSPALTYLADLVPPVSPAHVAPPQTAPAAREVSPAPGARRS